MPGPVYRICPQGPPILSHQVTLIATGSFLQSILAAPLILVRIPESTNSRQLEELAVFGAFLCSPFVDIGSTLLESTYAEPQLETLRFLLSISSLAPMAQPLNSRSHHYCGCPVVRARCEGGLAHAFTNSQKCGLL